MPGSTDIVEDRSSHAADVVTEKTAPSSLSQNDAVLSERASLESVDQRSAGFIGKNLLQCFINKYCAETNPKGMIDLAVAENRLMHNELIQKFSSPDFLKYDKSMFLYGESSGIQILRKAIAEFLTERGNAPEPLDVDKLVVMNGSTSCIESLAYCIGDPNDAFLSPTPYYGFAARDTKLRPQVNLYPVHLSSKPQPEESQPFELTIARLEEALQEATKKGIRIRGLFLMNPSNPLGGIYTEKLVMDMLLFCKRHSLHVILDEVYLTSIYEPGVRHSSVLRLRTEDIPDPERTHFIWAVSKDLGLSGMRTGVIYTWSQQVLTVLKVIADITQVPICVQHMMAKLLQDKEFLDKVFFPLNHQRLRESYRIVTDKLTELGIPFLHSSAGLFVWADFSKYLQERTFKAEQCLMDRFLENDVAVQPSQHFFGHEADAGWFRIIFSNEPDILRLGLEKISKCIKDMDMEG